MADSWCPSDWIGLVEWMYMQGEYPANVPLPGDASFMGFYRCLKGSDRPIAKLDIFNSLVINDIPRPLDYIASEIAPVFNKRYGKEVGA